MGSLIERKKKIMMMLRKSSGGLILFDGVDNTSVTGGWTTKINTLDKIAINQGDGVIKFESTAGSTSLQQMSYVTNQKIDFTSYNKLSIHYNSFFYNPIAAASYKGTVACLLNSATASPNYNVFLCDGNLLNAEQSNIKLEFDISNYSGEYYFAVAVYANYGVRGDSSNHYGLLWEIDKISLE